VSLMAELSDDFAPEVQRRGAAHHRSGDVVFLDVSDCSLTASVEGAEVHRVEIGIQNGELFSSCSCANFRDLGPCEHLYAVLLASEKCGFLASTLGLASDDDEADYWEDDAEDEESEDNYFLDFPGQRRGRTSGSPGSAKVGWKELLESTNNPFAGETNSRLWRRGTQVVYAVDRENTMRDRGLAIQLLCRQRRAGGDWGKLKDLRIHNRREAHEAPETGDRRILASLLGAPRGYRSDYVDMSSAQILTGALCDALLPEMCATGRLFVRRKPDAELTGPLALDPGSPWRLVLRLRQSGDPQRYDIDAILRREDQSMDLNKPELLLSGNVLAGGGYDPGWLFTDSALARLNDFGAFRWISHLRREPTLPLPASEVQVFLEKLLTSSHLPELDLPEELLFEEVVGEPRPRLRIAKPEKGSRSGLADKSLPVHLEFRYDGQTVSSAASAPGIYDSANRRLLRRDAAAEGAARRRLQELGFREPGRSYWGGVNFDLQVNPSRLPRAVRELTAEGWHVEAQGKCYRQATGFDISVRSEIDWFELHGGVKFGATGATIPALLSAVRKGENTVVLDDGSLGVLPEDWLARWAPLMQMGKPREDHLRFSCSQAALLDVLLAAQPQADCDQIFSEARSKLRSFEALRPAKEPPGFCGQLRGYQREGLGWLNFLKDFGFGGCLADDMGLGKTVQVLALLQADAEARVAGQHLPRPSLVVMPRSLLHNWAAEAARFAPGLRVLRYAGTDRRREPEAFADFDLVLTTYGTLRRDATFLKDVEFNYAVLDEAQAIKNPSTAAAKAARLLTARGRLALTGTPVENHLNDLWSIMEFLNPGMLGTAGVFSKLTLKRGGLSEEHCELLGRALRPFILRRTKAQVAADLPEKIEQTLHCELQGRQLRDYRQLRDHYRGALLGAKDLSNNRIQVLEALLRLRQAACHPGLIDRARIGEDSAKLEALLPQLQEVAEEGSKALVFSQFTSFLSIVRGRLDDLGLKYEYLDGRTRNRAEKVERFQNSPDCRLFLISLKAGGLGLNLTAAEYVFLLDPWWNPAVEAQAVDRAHRIGQTRKVFAYRLICRDTVEEKILELQSRKRRMAEAIISADRSVLSGLTREDLELLLS
jgi:superfamily II DNA or RNA helicase